MLALLAGCGFEKGLSPSDRIIDAPLADVSPDAQPVQCTGWPSWNASNVGACAAGPTLPGPFDVIGGTYDTTTGDYTPTGEPTRRGLGALVMQQDPTGTRVRVLAVTSLNVPSGQRLVVTGMYPLILLVHGDATVAGTIDVSSRSIIAAGPGAVSPPLCGQSLGGSGGNSNDPGEGGGGGGGGGFGRMGGQGASASNGGGAGSAGGAAPGLDLVPLRGGCAGGTGGIESGSAGAGAGGAAAGALQISVRDTLVLAAGQLRANGAGGQGGTMGLAGGGGGGSGGALLVEAGTIDIQTNSRLCANGGSGGEGAGPNAGAPGTIDGCTETGAVTMDLATNGGEGGAGGHKGSNSGDGGQGNGKRSGGGGGGGVGRIRIVERTGDVTPQIAGGVVISPDPN